MRIWWIALLVLGIDCFSKAYVHEHIPLMSYGVLEYPYGGISVFRDFFGIDFSIVHVCNKGIAWGWLSGLQDYLPYIRLSIIAVLMVYLFSSVAEKWKRVYLTLIIAGALGNVLDHFLYHHVIDIFYFTFWGHSYPVFNWADSAIFCGIIGLLLYRKRPVHVPN